MCGEIDGGGEGEKKGKDKNQTERYWGPPGVGPGDGGHGTSRVSETLFPPFNYIYHQTPDARRHPQRWTTLLVDPASKRKCSAPLT